MRILIYGAGNIGCLYAARLAESGQDVVIMARGNRHDSLRDHGVSMEDAVSGECTTTRVPVINRLDPQDAYDLVLVVLPESALAEVLPILAANERTPSVMFFANHVSGPEPMISALGKDRVLLGFPGAAAIPRAGTIRYVITSRREQPTTVGELEGRRTERLATIAGVLEQAGFPTSISTNMDAWLKTHAAKILPTCGALFYAGGRVDKLATHDKAMRLMVRAMRECLQILRANGIPITPANHRVLLWLPEWLIVLGMKRMFRSETMAIKVGHAEDAKREFQMLAQDFLALNEATRLPTPAMKQLFGHHDAATPVPD